MDADLLDLGDCQGDLPDEKNRIVVEYEGKENIVAWYKGLDGKDIEDAILCACDCIVDSGFSLIDLDGFPASVGSVVPGSRYTLRLGSEVAGKEKVLGSRFRRLSVEIEPLKHLESLRALECMKAGSNLLKHTRNSMPHIRLFQITQDLKFLIWYSSGKTQAQSSVLTENILEIVAGQKTQNFEDYPIPSLQHLSFSIIHTNGTLDLTCRDEREFDLWMIGLKALNFTYRELKVSKQVLLSHSRRFNEYLKANQLALATSVIYKEPETKKLEECISRKKLMKEDIAIKLKNIHKKLTKIAERVLDLPDDLAEYNQGFKSLEAYGGEYVEIGIEDFANDEIFHTEQHRLKDLNGECRSKLVMLESEFSSKVCKSNDDTSAFETELWRLEIDVENLADIVSRVESVAGEKWGKKFKSWFNELF